jgi:hypothetical protein
MGYFRDRPVPTPLENSAVQCSPGIEEQGGREGVRQVLIGLAERWDACVRGGSSL